MIARHTKLILAVLSLSAALLLVFMVLDIYNIRAQNEETSRLLNTADQAANQKVLSQSIRSFQNQAKNDIALLDNLILTEGRLVPVIEDIEQAGRSLGLQTKIISVDQPDNKGAEVSRQIKLVVETSGSWSGNYSFLKALESLPTRVVIDEARLSKEGSSWQSRITLSLYLFN
ncbi:MAG: hypothetical protein UY54_C0019G0016 [Parcubacteria group bacterium GW2011_GWA2_50_10b]|nr:MAG: hypothetical protein UY54_C0019G0016 [Parcubacteria group bacterium GW2011_GWA2_50_10b]